MRGQFDYKEAAKGCFSCDGAVVRPAFGGGHMSVSICESSWNCIPKKSRFYCMII